MYEKPTLGQDDENVVLDHDEETILLCSWEGERHFGCPEFWWSTSHKIYMEWDNMLMLTNKRPIIFLI